MSVVKPTPSTCRQQWPFRANLYVPAPAEIEGHFRIVLVYSPDFNRPDDDRYREGYYINATEQWRVAGSPSEANVTHWRFLPTPPT